jgi:putative pyruvate formate lyase activating enzyme
MPETLELLADLVDIYLPDLKTTDGALGARYFNAPDYPETACRAIKKMLEMGTLKRRFSGGTPPLMIRHLVLPDHLDSTRGVLGWFAENIQNRGNPPPLLSLMFQYTPVGEAKNPAGGRTGGSAAPGRCVGREEYHTVLDWLAEFGIEDGFCQDLVPGGALPDFERANPFPSELAVPVWHWRRGFL